MIGLRCYVAWQQQLRMPSYEPLKFSIMKKLISVLIFMIPLLVLSQSCVPPGPVMGTWTYEGSPYYVYGDIYVESDAMLEIEPGVIVYFKGWYDFSIYGKLKAIGTAEDMIRFTSVSPSHVNWKGMSFRDTDRSSDLAYCIFDAGLKSLDEDDESYNSGGGVSVLNSPKARITFRNCIIRNNEAYYGGGVHVSNSIPRFYNCRIINNEAVVGGGINMINHGNIVLTKSLIQENTALLGAGINLYNSKPRLSFNKIQYNSASDYGGGLRIVSARGFKLEKNEIVHNSATKGGGMCINYSDGYFCSNTIANNEAMIMGGGLFIYGISLPQFMNNIIYFNKSYISTKGEQVYLQSAGSDPGFQYCNIEDGLSGFGGAGVLNYYGFYNDNLESDPIFEDALSGNYNISWKNYPFDDETKSPCIDAGCPTLEGDPDCSCCDIGAHYYLQVLEEPAALNPFICVPDLSFIATWTTSYGALGYYLDVAKDPGFHKYVVKDLAVCDTSCMVSVYVPYTYYYRVRSFNTGITSDYSNVIEVKVKETETIKLRDMAIIRSTPGKVYIDLDNELSGSGELSVYNLAGQLISTQNVTSGSNTLEFSCSEQIVLINLIMDGKVYQDKVYIH